MVGLGTMLIFADDAVRVVAVARPALSEVARLLWPLMLAMPFPLHRGPTGRLDDRGNWGRQTVVDLRPWMRTSEGFSSRVSGRQRTLHADGLLWACTWFSEILFFVSGSIARIEPRTPRGETVA